MTTDQIVDQFFQCKGFDEIEAFTKQLPLSQLKELLKNHLFHHQVTHESAAPLISSISRTSITFLLLDPNPIYTHFFIEHAGLESLHHHLVTILTELQDQASLLEKRVNETEKRIFSILPGTITFEQQHDLLKMMESLSSLISDIVNPLLKRLLTLVWNTSQKNLIEDFSKLNDYLLHLAKDGIGHPALDKKPSTGLYALLNEHFSKVYLCSFALPSIEGLSFLSFKSAADYQTAGIIQTICKEEEVSDVVQKALDALGLHTIQDLINNQIYSKYGLIAFVKHQ